MSICTSNKPQSFNRKPYNCEELFNSETFTSEDEPNMIEEYEVNFQMLTSEIQKQS